MKKNLLIKILSVMMVLTMGVSTGCGNGNSSSPESEKTSQSESNSTKEPESESASESESGSSAEPEGYRYGEDWLDVYDAAYTEELLSAGDLEFTKSQISGSYLDGDSEIKTHAKKTGGKYVGIFYFMWLGEGWGNIYDISKLQEKYNPYDTANGTNPLWAIENHKGYDASISPMNAFHYFEEPMYGYYNSWDTWVIRRHLELLSMAGIDFLYLDFTNANVGGTNLYQKATIALLDEILAMQKLGYDVPQIVPICCNPYTGSDKAVTQVVEWVYDNYYAKDNFKYKSCWFTADPVRNPSGKPLLVTYGFDSQYLSKKEVANAFWIRNVVWPTAVTSSSYANGFPWMDYSYPQENYGGIMNVSIAQHIGGSWSSEAFLAKNKGNKGLTYRGRGALPAQKYAYQTDSLEAAKLGYNFSGEWKNVLNYSGSEEVWMVTVTGWNEWVAQKLNTGNSYATFVDTFNVAFSRDIEMMRDENGYGDNYFLQLCEYVREFKYGKATGKKSSSAMWMRKTIDITNLSAWNDVKAKYVDFTSDAQNRNEKSAANKYTYTDNSARNDIDYIKIANDSENLYVLVAAKDDITDYTEGDFNWMNLWLSTNRGTGWNGYDFYINRTPGTNGETTIDRLGTDADGKITTEKLSFAANYYKEGKFIAYKIPLEALGVTSADEIGLKATDNIFANKATAQNDGVGVYSFGDIFAFYCGGDCAPIGRLNYAYRMAY